MKERQLESIDMASLEPSSSEASLLASTQALIAPSAIGSATRVSQVDATRLETEFCSILMEQLNDVMRCAPPDFRDRVAVRLQCCRWQGNACTSFPATICPHAQL